MRVFRWLSIWLFSLALLSLLGLFVTDFLTYFHYLRPMHQKMGAIPLMAIGFSYLSYQMSVRYHGRIKAFVLGLAFVLWGGEQIYAAPMFVDELVIAIFVIDLVLIIREHLKIRDIETP